MYFEVQTQKERSRLTFASQKMKQNHDETRIEKIKIGQETYSFIEEIDGC